jgi:hypothetical protein
MADQKQQKYMCWDAIHIFNSWSCNPNSACNSTPFKLLQLFHVHFLLMILLQEANSCCHLYYVAKGVATQLQFLALIPKTGHK